MDVHGILWGRTPVGERPQTGCGRGCRHTTRFHGLRSTWPFRPCCIVLAMYIAPTVTVQYSVKASRSDIQTNMAAPQSSSTPTTASTENITSSEEEIHEQSSSAYEKQTSTPPSQIEISPNSDSPLATEDSSGPHIPSKHSAPDETESVEAQAVEQQFAVAGPPASAIVMTNHDYNKENLLQLEIVGSDGETSWVSEFDLHKKRPEALLSLWANRKDGRLQRFVDGEEVFQVFAILDHKIVYHNGRKITKVRVQWVGFDDNEDTTWEPKKKIAEIAPHISQEYWARANGA